MTDQEQFQLPGLNQNRLSATEPPAIKLPPGLQAGIGLAVASLVLGLISLPLSLFVIGVAPGLVGLIVAIVHLHKRCMFRAMVVWGLALSIVGVLAGTGFGLFYGISIYQTYKMMDELSSDKSDLIFRRFIGTESPDFTMTDVEGNEIKLSSLKGRRVVLNFWATWCPPCRLEIPSLIDLRNEVNPDELAIIGISDEDKQKLLDFVVKHNTNYTIAIAPDDLPSPYSHITSIPTTFFLDSRGIIQDVLSGLHSFEEIKEKALAPDYKADPNEQLSSN